VRVQYTLRDRDLMRRIMQHPGRGTPHSVRTLAEASKCSPTTIGHLLSGERRDVHMDRAHRIAEALGVAVLVLFAPPSSPNSDGPSADSIRP
jgi:transcriptional regulator with XRE-family HTH domain